METLFREFNVWEEIPYSKYSVVYIDWTVKTTDDDWVAQSILDSEFDKIVLAYKWNDLVYDKAKQ